MECPGTFLQALGLKLTMKSIHFLNLALRRASPIIISAPFTVATYKDTSGSVYSRLTSLVHLSQIPRMEQKTALFSPRLENTEVGYSHSFHVISFQRTSSSILALVVNAHQYSYSLIIALLIHAAGCELEGFPFLHASKATHGR